MKLKMFTIRDSKAEIFNTPFYAHTHGEAERQFQRLAKDQTSMLSQFPEDYDLYHVGEYDDQTGKIETHDSPQHMIKAVNVLSS